jgi:hypothetical protein
LLTASTAGQAGGRARTPAPPTPSPRAGTGRPGTRVGPARGRVFTTRTGPGQPRGRRSRRLPPGQCPRPARPPPLSPRSAGRAGLPEGLPTLTGPRGRPAAQALAAVAAVPCGSAPHTRVRPASSAPLEPGCRPPPFPFFSVSSKGGRPPRAPRPAPLRPRPPATRTQGQAGARAPASEAPPPRRGAGGGGGAGRTRAGCVPVPASSCVLAPRHHQALFDFRTLLSWKES